MFKYRHQSIRNGLVGHWRPSRGPTGNTLIDSVRGNHGYFEGNPAWEANGGFALKFDGVDDRVGIPKVENIVGGLTNLTIACWVFRTAAGTKAQFGWGKFDSINKRAFVQWFTDNNIYVAFENGNSSFPFVNRTTTGWHHLAVCFDGSLTGNLRTSIYVNGVPQSLTSGGASPTTVIAYGLGDMNIGWDNVSGFCSSSYDDLFVSARTLTPSEILTTYTAGRGALDQRVNVPVVRGATVGGPTYTLTAATGSIALSGQVATPKVNRRLLCSQASFSQTGQAATLKASRKLVAAQGSVALTGQATNFAVARKLTAANGSLSVSGQAAALKASRKLTASFGSLTYTGNAATLQKIAANTLAAAAGTFTVAGQAAGLRISRRVSLTNASFAFSGFGATLSYSGQQSASLVIDFVSPSVAGGSLSVAVAAGELEPIEAAGELTVSKLGIS